MGVIVVYPDGTKDAGGSSFWNATDACCGFGRATVDDSAYLMAVVDKVTSDYRVDPKRVYFTGHSNGGFMAYRMACEHADRVAAIVSLAGATFADAVACAPTQPVSVAQVHGTNDAVISFSGGQIAGHAYPSAGVTTQTWADYAHCGSPLSVTGRTLDIDPTIDGAETVVRSSTGCPAGVGVELWTIDGGLHSPTLSTAFGTAVVDFLLAHPKP
jgi:polyhydroxybutyrate depolymerase